MKPITMALFLGAAIAGALAFMGQATPAGAPAGVTLTQTGRQSPHDAINVRLSGGGGGAGARGRGGFGGPLVTIYYGRPYKKGREIWGALVPWNQVWRLGSDEGTTLISQSDLQFGDFVLPAGAYTLEMLPVKDGTSKLVINKAVGYWGIPYTAIQAQELKQLDLKKEADANAPVEELTLSLSNNNGTGTLKIAWDKAVYSIDFTTKK